MDTHSLKVIEFYEILNLLAEQTGSTIGREKALSLFPLTHLESVLILLKETEEAFNIIDTEEIPIGGIRDIREALKIAGIKGRLTEMELLDTAQVLRVSREIITFFNKRKDKSIELYNMVSGITAYKKTEEAITTSISPKGEINNNASSKLASIRRNINELKSSIASKMGDLIKSSGYGKMLQEPIITTREGRYVVPVKSEFKGKFKGIVHDQSSSGVTLFMEPIFMVEKNNKLKKLYIEEKEEIDNILRNLSELISQDAEGIKYNLEILTNLDLIIARAKLAHKLKAIKPVISKTKKLKIIEGRHPLLKDNVVPVSIEIGEKFTCLIITGPNTGGKTVTLKLTGLFPLMAQTGLFIPAEEGTELPIIKSLYADIGDEQSISQSLSTFSSHIKQIIKIITEVDETSLVLLDELGAGTDPSEGAALAIAILEYLIKKEALCITTTHHNQLKAFGATNPMAENACVEFNIETLLPTYKLSIGQPGRSQALYIAERLGIPCEIIEEAKKKINQSAYDIDKLLEELKADKERLFKENLSLSYLKKDIEEIKKKEIQKAKENEEKRKKIAENLLEQSKEIISSIQKEVKETKQSLKKLVKNHKEIKQEESFKIIDELQEKLRLEEEIAEEFVSEIIPQEKVLLEPVKRIITGDYVQVISLGHRGYITEVTGDEVKLQVGMMNITAKASDIALARPEDYKSPEESYSNYIETDKILSVPGELNLISKRAEEAIFILEKYLDDATLARHSTVRIVHGKGTGVLRNLVKEYLKKSPLISSFRLGGVGEGGAGVTIAELK